MERNFPVIPIFRDFRPTSRGTPKISEWNSGKCLSICIPTWNFRNFLVEWKAPRDRGQRSWKILTALRTNQISGFVIVPSCKNYIFFKIVWPEPDRVTWASNKGLKKKNRPVSADQDATVIPADFVLWSSENLSALYSCQCLSRVWLKGRRLARLRCLISYWHSFRKDKPPYLAAANSGIIFHAGWTCSGDPLDLSSFNWSKQL